MARKGAVGKGVKKKAQKMRIRGKKESDLFSRVLFFFLPPLLATPLPFSRHLFALSPPPRKVLCPVEGRAQHTAWRGAVSG